MPRVFDTDIQGLATITAMQEQLDALEDKVSKLKEGLRKTVELCQQLHELDKLNRASIELMVKANELLQAEMEKRCG